MKSSRLELDDMQRLVLDGLSERPRATYALIEIGDPKRACRWIGEVLGRVARASQRDERAPEDLCLAFTINGLEKLGITDSIGFQTAFREGISKPDRAADLGDAPEKWDWGGTDPKGMEIHLLLMLFSREGEERSDWETLEKSLVGWAKNLTPLRGFLRENETEHFGFRDGISQPYIEGSNTSKRPVAANVVKPGEFILGYRNEAGVLPPSPRIPAALDKQGLLAPSPIDQSRRDFGRNGTYLVLRQIRQDVDRFNQYLEAQSKDKARQDWVAAKMIGRWRSGAPLVRTKEVDQREFKDDNDFSYHEEDRSGHACPLGAHIRRANPRDALVDERLGVGPEEAAGESRRHRILRRGRLYEDGKDKGLLFVCLNANLESQFEFIQHNWINGARFAGLSGETDPLVGARPVSGHCPMTLQAPDRPIRLEGLTNFVEVVGGAYFFLPSLNSLACLASLGD